jgi:hypothetical protein
MNIDDKTPKGAAGPKAFVQRYKMPMAAGMVGVAALVPMLNAFTEAHPCGEPGWDQCNFLLPDEAPPNGRVQLYTTVPLTMVTASTATISTV